MTINIAIDYVKWLVCILQCRNRFLNMSSKMGKIQSINFVCQGDILSKVSRSHEVSNLRNYVVNWPVNSGVWDFELRMLRKLCSLGRFRSYKKRLFMGTMNTPNLYTQRVKGIIVHFRKTVYINVYLHVNLTLPKVKTKN